MTRQHIQPPEITYDLLRIKLAEDAERLDKAVGDHRNPFWFAFMDVCIDSCTLIDWMYHDGRFNAADRFPNTKDFLADVRQRHFLISCANHLGLAFKHAGLHPTKKTQIVQLDAMRVEWVEHQVTLAPGGKMSEEVLKREITPVFEFVGGTPGPMTAANFSRMLMSGFDELEAQFFASATEHE